jgi:hypothetical protein
MTDKEIELTSEVKRLKEQLRIGIVSTQRETFNVFFMYLDNLTERAYDAKSITEHVEDYLKNI